MDTNELLQALQYSVGKTQQEVHLAEQYLKQAKTVQGYIPNSLLIACNQEVSDYVRQAAIVNLKSFVQENWTSTQADGFEIATKDKETLRDSILDALIQCVDKPRIFKQMEEIIKCVAYSDFPTTWRSILPDVVNKLKNSDKFTDIYGSLLVLKNLVLNFKTAEGLEREPLELIVSNTFPLLEVYAKNLLSNNSQQSAAAMHVILKTFFAANYNDMTKYVLDAKVVETWMSFFKFIIDKSLGPELESATQDQNEINQRAKSVFWLNKKACGKILVHFMRIYVKPKPLPTDQYLGVTQLFLQNYAIPFLESFVQILFKKKQEYVPVKVIYFAMKYVYRALSFPDLEKLLSVHLETLLFDLLIPSMFLTVEDNDNWSTNPIEFIRKEADLLERPNNLQSVAKDYLVTICSSTYCAPDGELFLIKFMKYAAHVLTHGVDPRTNVQTDLIMKEALMHIIGNLKEYILENEYLRQNMEFLLDQYVIPECKNQVGFLRYRACWLFGRYGGLNYHNSQIVKNAVENLYNCLQDSEFPVRVNAGIAMYRILRQPEVKDYLKPVLAKILETYLSLIDQMDSDELVQSLEGFISQFEDDIHPYAVAIIENLARTFEKAQTQEQNDDASDAEGEEDERTFAADECLSAIARIIKCNLAKETLAHIENIVAPIIQYTLSEQGMDYIISGLNILIGILYHSEVISEKMWSFFPELNYIIAGKPEELIQNNFSHFSEEKKALMRQQATGWGYEFVDNIIPAFQNYIQKGRHVLFAARDNYFNLTYIEVLFRSIDRIFEIFHNSKVSTEAVFVSLLFICLLENFPQQINEIIPHILDKVIANLQYNDRDLKKILMETVSMCFWYDTFLTLQYLESKGATQFIFETWIGLLPEYTQDFECQRIMFGLASILRVDVRKLPQLLIDSLPGLFQEMVKLSAKIMEIKENGEYEDEAEEDVDAEKKALHKLQKANQRNANEGIDVLNDEEDDDDEDDEDYNDLEGFEQDEKGEYSSPLEDICEVLFFKETLEMLQHNQSDVYNHLISCLHDNDKLNLENNFKKAVSDQIEFEKYKQEEAQKAQLKGMGRQ